jgi:hypothetical protein
MNFKTTDKKDVNIENIVNTKSMPNTHVDRYKNWYCVTLNGISFSVSDDCWKCCITVSKRGYWSIVTAAFSETNAFFPLLTDHEHIPHCLCFSHHDLHDIDSDITNSIQQSPPWEANSHSASQWISCLSESLNIRLCVHKILLLIPILNQMNPIKIFSSCFS